MGAIIGRLSFDAEETLARTVLDRMLDASVQHPAAARGVFAAPGIAFACCGAPRIASASAARENTAALIGINSNRTIRVVADSALTNVGDLQAALERDGHRFSTGSDDELIAHAYERWGTRAFARLRGPFACVVWDEPNRRLVLARDHVGIRPLYFAVLHAHGLVFASEIRALLQDPGVDRDWCPGGIDAYLALGYVPAPLTAYRRVSKLEPAHILVVEGRRLHLEEYWDLPVASPSTAPQDVVGALKSALAATVRRELAGHRQAALLYSGGIASCALLSVADNTAGVPITADVDEDPADLTRSDAAAAHLGRVRELETMTRPMWSVIDDLTAISGEPIADPAALTQFAICQAAAKHSDVALSGHGASVLWAPSARRRSLLSHLTVPGQDSPVKASYRLWDGEYRRAIYTRGFAWQVRDANPFAHHLERYAARATDDPVDRSLYVDARTLLPDNTLAIAERAAAAAGITLRYPFLDRQLVNLAMVTPVHQKQHGRLDMFALRRLLMQQLPPRLLPTALRRPGRHAWMSAVLPMLVPKILLGPRFDGRGIVSRPALRQLWNDHVSSRADHSRRLWALLMLEFWFRGFIDGDAAAEPLEYAVLVKAA